MISSRAFLVLVPILLVATAGRARAQMLPEAEYPVTTKLEFAPAEAAPGQRVTAKLLVTVGPGYHIYGVEPPPDFEYFPSKPELVLPAGWTPAGDLRAPAPVVHEDPTLGGQKVPWYVDSVTFEQDFVVPRDAPPGEREISFRLDHSVCDDMYCLPPQDVTATGVLAVLDVPAVAPAPTVEPAPPGAAGPRREERKGASGFLLVAFLGGLGSILLPCVYPLIPLTIAFFSKGEERSRGKEVLRAVLFCVGILLTFTVLGIALGQFLQQIAVSVWLNVFLFLLMAVLALSLLGMFDIQLPSSWTSKLQIAGTGASIGAPIFMGVAFSFASFSCTVGVIGPILAGGASDVGRSATGMFAYSVGFALPFFLLALFPMVVSSMPRSGGWMNTMKVLLGFFEICFAGYYLWRMDLGLGWGIGTWPIILSLWTVTTAVAGLYLLGKIRLPKDDPVEKVTVPRAVGAILFLTFALYLFSGLMGKLVLPDWVQGLLPPPEVAAASEGGSGGVATAPPAPRPEFADDEFHPSPMNGLWWTADLAHAKEVAKKTGRRLLLNFTGIYCSNCRQVETGMFRNDPALREALSEMVLAELWTDVTTEAAERKKWDLHHTTVEQSERYNRLRIDEYGTVANPYYAILSPDGEVIAELGYPTGGAAEMLAFLRAGK